MAPKGRRRSLLEDDEVAEISGRDESSSGDVCDRCGCTRGRHGEDGCTCGKCEKFVDG